MTRAAAREIAVQLCFAQYANAEGAAEALDSFFDKEYYGTLADQSEGFSDYPNGKQRDYIRGIVMGVIEHREEIDGYIEKFAKGWKISRISRTALAVLRVAVYEILYVSDVPSGVAISEAVELSKGYDVPETVSFINGVLGSFVRALETPQTLPLVDEPQAEVPSETAE